MNYKQAIRKIADTRQALLSGYAQKKSDALKAVPPYSAAFYRLRTLLFDEASGALTDEDQAEKKALIKAVADYEQKLGLIPPPPTCTKCRDTGLAAGRPCACAVNLALQSQEDIGIPLQRFEEANFSRLDEKTRESTQTTFRTVYDILQKYPLSPVKNLVMMGGTGTGKTFLAGCAAHFMLEKGASVAAMTAFSLNNRFLKYHTTFDEKKSAFLDPILDCEFLVIDDLGTESRLKNVTLEYLYTVLNERILKGRVTFITTNLSPESLLSAYGERIYSRLFDKSLCYRRLLTGNDQRLF